MSRPRKIVILGSTGSIGCSTIDVLRQHPGKFRVLALAGYGNHKLLAEQCREFMPAYAVMVDETAAAKLRRELADTPIDVCSGLDDLVKLAKLADADLILNAIVGAAGLRASLAAVEAGKYLALANKESLVAGGPLFSKMFESGQPKILPVDSEHSAIWQALRAGREGEVRNLVLTSSGGPFRTWPRERFADITVEDALNHPTWNMGAKITIDSSTLANKGLEVIEAAVLFRIPTDRIKVVVHPQSIVHSMVEFLDSSVLAQLSLPDMRLPISYALFWPERSESPFGAIDWTKMSDLTFEAPDLDRFDALRLAFEVAETGDTAPAVYNAANEIAVEAFLKRTIGYLDIAATIRRTVEKVEHRTVASLEDVLEADREARAVAARVVKG